LNFTPVGTFAVDLPNCNYKVTVTTGDLQYARDQMGIFLEGTQVDSVTTAAGQIVTPSYTVTVSDGQLNLQMKDLGGSDPNTVIEGLDIVPSGPDTTGPHVTASSPTGTINGSVNHVALTFSEPILDGTFTLADVDALTGPAGAITATAVTKISNIQYEVDFPSQTALGNYSLTIGPNITDVAGNAMDQNQNGTNGEDPADRYTATFTMAAFMGAHFDFGTPTSAVASGYTQVTEFTQYSAGQGYGWQSGTIGSRDRGTGTDLTRDLNFTPDGTFAVDLPNGTYKVTVTTGDLMYARDQMGIFLEGTQVDSVTTAAGQIVTPTYTVTVSDGQLNLQMKDLGGSDPNTVIEGLDIVPSGT
jgi:fibronectin type 3 domain-containing protein